MSCKHCTDPDDVACFPQCGIGPHTHRPGPAIGSTVMLADQTMPGYTPNPDEPGMGVHWCPHCGDGKPPSTESYPEHAASADCWCVPEVEYRDPETGTAVYVHKEVQ